MRRSRIGRPSVSIGCMPRAYGTRGGLLPRETETCSRWSDTRLWLKPEPECCGLWLQPEPRSSPRMETRPRSVPSSVARCREPGPRSSRSSWSRRSGATRSCRCRRPSRSTRSSPSSRFASRSPRPRSRPSPGGRFALFRARGWAAGLGAGVLLAAAYGFQTAGLELTTVSSTGFITGLYVVFTPLLALALFGTPVPGLAWVGVALSVAGLAAAQRRRREGRSPGTCSCSRTPSRSRSRSSRWSGSRRATTRARSRSSR